MRSLNLVMKHIKLRSQIPPVRKAFLIAGTLTLLISTCVIFPTERSKTNFLEDFVYTFSSLALSLLMLMFGLMGRDFFKGLLFLLLSSIIAAVFFYVAYPLAPFAYFVAFWLGVPSGIVTALLFMTINFYFFKNIKKYKLLKQSIAYVIILLIVCVLFGYGGDWINI